MSPSFAHVNECVPPPSAIPAIHEALSIEIEYIQEGFIGDCSDCASVGQVVSVFFQVATGHDATVGLLQRSVVLTLVVVVSSAKKALTEIYFATTAHDLDQDLDK